MKHNWLVIVQLTNVIMQLFAIKITIENKSLTFTIHCNDIKDKAKVVFFYIKFHLFSALIMAKYHVKKLQ